MHKPRYIFRLTKAFLKRFKGLILIGAVFGVVVFFLISAVMPATSKGSEERIAVVGRYHTDNLPTSILHRISSGLTKVNSQGIAEPDLAESWETPDSGKTWVFKLKDDTTWQDGERVTSDSIVYEFLDVETEKPDPQTIIFKLQDPFSPFPTVLSRPTFRQGLLGTGQWRADRVSVSGGIVHELVIVDEQSNKKIYKFYPTTDRAKLAYKLGEVDKVLNLLEPSPLNNWETVQSTPRLDTNQVVTLFFNTQDSFLQDKSLRQSLAYAIDKKNLGDMRALSPISEDSWVYNPQVKDYAYDAARAAELLDEFPDEVKNNLEIKLVSSPTLLPVAEKIASDWEQVGVQTVVQVSSVVPTEYQAYLTILDIPQDPDQYPIWHSTQSSTNISHYSNPRIDKLLEDGRSILDLDERKRIYLDFQRFLLEDLPAIFLYHPTYYTIERR